MWNWVKVFITDKLVSGLGTGACLVLYDGSPFQPSSYRLWELVDEYKITHFGVSAKYLQTIEMESLKPCNRYR
jgi:acetoacetyl-CoA synthetase